MRDEINVEIRQIPPWFPNLSGGFADWFTAEILKRKPGETQRFRTTLTYRYYDTGWVLEGFK